RGTIFRTAKFGAPYATTPFHFCHQALNATTESILSMSSVIDPKKKTSASAATVKKLKKARKAK
ncbi:MAG: hypothetical protein KDA59_14455, partial [Planctomycetales bacterium]|nr:hypothetical protein [Planctomycetales bacterium]